MVAAQIYSTASYASHNLKGVLLANNDLSGWDFSGQDLTGASFAVSRFAMRYFTRKRREKERAELALKGDQRSRQVRRAEERRKR